MSRGALNLLLFLLFLGSLGLHLVMGRDLRQRNLEFMPDMAHSPAYDTYAPNPNFPDGKTVQLPQPGTIARGRLPLHYGVTPQEAARAGKKLRNPYAANNARALKRGAFVYANYCQMCHGAQGKGGGIIAQHGLPPPASLLGENAREMKDGQMFHVLTYGQRNMSSLAAQLSRADRWKVIGYIRSLQRQAPGEEEP
jgi:mono/diheme cytochrome c family protein